MLAVGIFSGPGFNSQINSSSFVAMQNSLGVRSRSTPESEAIDKEASIKLQRVLAEAFAEFDFENELPQVSQCVERWRIAKEETAKEEAGKRSRTFRTKPQPKPSL